MEFLLIQVKGEDAIVAGTGDEKFTLVDTDALAVGKVRILPGALQIELLVVSQQAIAGSDVQSISIQRHSAQTTSALFAEPFDVRKVVLDRMENRLVCEVHDIGAAVGFTLGGAVYDRRSQ